MQPYLGQAARKFGQPTKLAGRALCGPPSGGFWSWAPWSYKSEQGRSEKIVWAEKRYIIEVSGKGTGVLIAADGGYVFYAALPEARSLDQRVFRSLEQAQKNISQELTRKRKPT